MPLKEVPLVSGAPRSPERTCVGCRAVRPQGDLLRLAATREGVRFDPTRRLPGRGVYLCPDPDCLSAATRRGGAALRRALRGAPQEGLEAALEALRAELAHHQVLVSTVRSENA